MAQRWRWRSNLYLDAILNREAKLNYAFKVKNFLMEQKPHSWCITLLELKQYRREHRLGGTRTAYFAKDHPYVFELRGTPWEIHFTDTARALLEQQRAVREGDEHRRFVIDSLAKLLMMSSSREIRLDKISKLRLVLGFPPDYETSIFLEDQKKYNRFRVVQGRDGYQYLKLTKWDPSLAVTARENWVARTGVKNPHAFPEPQQQQECKDQQQLQQECKDQQQLQQECKEQQQLLQQECKEQQQECKVDDDDNRSEVSEYFESLQSTAFPSPYADVLSLDTCSAAAQKRAVAVVHEILSLTIEKRALIHQLEQFQEEFLLPEDLFEFIEQHRGIFYISRKEGRLTVFLREAYDETCSNFQHKDDKYPLWRMKERFIAMAMTVRLEEFDKLPARGSAYNDTVVADSELHVGNDNLYSSHTEDTNDSDGWCMLGQPHCVYRSWGDSMVRYRPRQKRRR